MCLGSHANAEPCIHPPSARSSIESRTATTQAESRLTAITSLSFPPSTPKPQIQNSLARPWFSKPRRAAGSTAHSRLHRNSPVPNVTREECEGCSPCHLGSILPAMPRAEHVLGGLPGMFYRPAGLNEMASYAPCHNCSQRPAAPGGRRPCSSQVK